MLDWVTLLRVLFLFLLNVRAAFIVALMIPFSLLFASIWLDLSHIPANLLSLALWTSGWWSMAPW
jgi:heavy metal efflux system protein